MIEEVSPARDHLTSDGLAISRKPRTIPCDLPEIDELQIIHERRVGTDGAIRRSARTVRLCGRVGWGWGHVG